MKLTDVGSGGCGGGGANCLTAYSAYSVTPITNRRSLFASRIEKAVQTIRNNYNLSSSTSNCNNNGLGKCSNATAVNASAGADAFSAAPAAHHIHLPSSTNFNNNAITNGIVCSNGTNSNCSYLFCFVTYLTL